MRGILADNNVGAQVNALLLICASDTWRLLWNDLGLVVEDLPGLGLSDDATDAVIWRTCQRDGLVLITANRNQRGPSSLETVIRKENQPASLPVVTIADANRLLRDRLYAEKAAESLLEKLISIDDFRGAGRIYVL